MSFSLLFGPESKDLQTLDLNPAAMQRWQGLLAELHHLGLHGLWYQARPRRRQLRLDFLGHSWLRFRGPDKLKPELLLSLLEENLPWIQREQTRQSQKVMLQRPETKQAYRALQDETAQWVESFLATWSGPQPKSWRLTWMQSRWGSCNAKQKITLHTGLSYLPPSLRRYILLHELAHLVELNHSPAFWHLLAQWDPNYAKAEAALRSYLLLPTDVISDLEQAGSRRQNEA